MALEILFKRGNKPADLSGLNANYIYFFEDTAEIYMGGKLYGGNAETINNLVNDVDALEALVGSKSVAVQIQEYVNGLDLANTYATKSDLEKETARATAAEQANASAAKTAEDAAKAAQGDVDALETTVGTLRTEFDAEVIRATAAEEANAKGVQEAKEAAAAAQTAANDARGVADAATTAANNAQSDVDALEEFVGTLPDGSQATTVIDYIDIKTAGFETSGTITEIQSQLQAAQQNIAAIQGDYLTSEDKTELQGNIDTTNARIDVLVGEDNNKSIRAIAAEELAAQLIPADAQESLDTLEELAAWIQAHPDDATAMNKAINDLKTYVGTIPEGATAKDIVAYIQEAVKAEQDRALGVEAAQQSRIEAAEGKITTLEGKVTTLEGDVADAVQAASDANAAALAADAKAVAAQGEVDALETEVAGKAAQADLESAVGRIATAEGKITTLEGKAHEHANKTILDGITSDNISAWNNAEKNANAYTDAALTWGTI